MTFKHLLIMCFTSAKRDLKYMKRCQSCEALYTLLKEGGGQERHSLPGELKEKGTRKEEEREKE